VLLIGFRLIRSPLVSRRVLLVRVFLLALALVLGRLLIPWAIVVLLVRGGRTRERSLVVVDDRGARQPTEQQGARKEKDPEVPKTLEEGCYQVTSPTNAVGASSGRSPTNICGVERIQRLAIAGLAIAATGACGLHAQRSQQAPACHVLLMRRARPIGKTRKVIR